MELRFTHGDMASVVFDRVNMPITRKCELLAVLVASLHSPQRVHQLWKDGPDSDAPNKVRATYTEADPGISLLELLVNWMVSSGMEVPIVIPPDKRPKHPRFCDAYIIRVGPQDPIVYALPWTWKQAIQ